MNNPFAQIGIAFIGAVTAVTGAWITAQGTASKEVQDVDTKVQVLERTQLLQYTEIKESLGRIERQVGIPQP